MQKKTSNPSLTCPFEEIPYEFHCHTYCAKNESFYSENCVIPDNIDDRAAN